MPNKYLKINIVRINDSGRRIKLGEVTEFIMGDDGEIFVTATFTDNTALKRAINHPGAHELYFNDLYVPGLGVT